MSSASGTSTGEIPPAPGRQTARRAGCSTPSSSTTRPNRRRRPGHSCGPAPTRRGRGRRAWPGSAGRRRCGARPAGAGRLKPRTSRGRARARAPGRPGGRRPWRERRPVSRRPRSGRAIRWWSMDVKSAARAATAVKATRRTRPAGTASVVVFRVRFSVMPAASGDRRPPRKGSWSRSFRDRPGRARRAASSPLNPASRARSTTCTRSEVRNFPKIDETTLRTVLGLRNSR